MVTRTAGRVLASSDINEENEAHQWENARYKRVFDLFDADGSGHISKENLSSLFSTLGIKAQAGEEEKIISEFDTDGNSTIEFEEFLAMIKQLVRDQEAEEQNHKDPTISQAGPFVLRKNHLRKSFVKECQATCFLSGEARLTLDLKRKQHGGALSLTHFLDPEVLSRLILNSDDADGSSDSLTSKQVEALDSAIALVADVQGAAASTPAINYDEGTQAKKETSAIQDGVVQAILPPTSPSSASASASPITPTNLNLKGFVPTPPDGPAPSSNGGRGGDALSRAYVRHDSRRSQLGKFAEAPGRLSLSGLDHSTSIKPSLDPASSSEASVESDKDSAMPIQDVVKLLEGRFGGALMILSQRLEKLESMQRTNKEKSETSELMLQLQGVVAGVSDLNVAISTARCNLDFHAPKASTAAVVPDTVEEAQSTLKYLASKCVNDFHLLLPLLKRAVRLGTQGSGTDPAALLELDKLVSTAVHLIDQYILNLGSKSLATTANVIALAMRWKRKGLSNSEPIMEPVIEE